MWKFFCYREVIGDDICNLEGRQSEVAEDQEDGQGDDQEDRREELEQRLVGD